MSKKLIIHETDCHGCGTIVYNGHVESYSYDDSYFGDVASTVQALIDIGFINKDDVKIFKGDDFYKFAEDKICNNQTQETNTQEQTPVENKEIIELRNSLRRIDECLDFKSLLSKNEENLQKSEYDDALAGFGSDCSKETWAFTMLNYDYKKIINFIEEVN